MKIESLNIWGAKMYEPFMEHVTRQRKEIDIFCFQEVFDDAVIHKSRLVSDAVMDIYGKLVKALPEHIGYFASSQEKEEGIAMFVKKDIAVKDFGDIFVYRWKDAMVGDDARTLGRNLQYTEIVHNGIPLIIANFHGLWNGQGKTDTPDRLEQSENLHSFLETRNGQKILVGDFNLRPDTKSLEIAGQGMRNLVAEHEVTSTRSELYEKSEKFADYIFVSPDLEVKDFEVLQDTVSDHLPLVVEIA